MYGGRSLLGEWYVICALAVMFSGGARMLWSSFTPVDPYTRRLRGDQPFWGRLLGVFFGLGLFLTGLCGLAVLLLGNAAWFARWFS